MPRTPYRLIVRDDDGPVLINARVFPRLVGTATPLPDAFPTATGGAAAQSFVTNTQGEAQFWTDAYREDIDVQVTDNGGAAYPPGGIAGTFASYIETVQVPAPNGTLARLPAAGDAIRFVTSGGNDANDGLSWGSAKATIQAALNTLPAYAAGAGGGVVKAGLGTFAGFTLTSGQYVHGVAKRATRIEGNVNAPVVSSATDGGANPLNAYGGLFNLFVRNTNAGALAKAAYFHQFSNLSMMLVSLQAVPVGGAIAQFRACIVSEFTSVGFGGAAGADSACTLEASNNDITFDDCSFTDAKSGLISLGGIVLNVKGCHFETLAGGAVRNSAIYLDGTIGGEISGNYAESCVCSFLTFGSAVSGSTSGFKVGPNWATNMASPFINAAAARFCDFGPNYFVPGANSPNANGLVLGADAQDCTVGVHKLTSGTGAAILVDAAALRIQRLDSAGMAAAFQKVQTGLRSAFYATQPGGSVASNKTLNDEVAFAAPFDVAKARTLTKIGVSITVAGAGAGPVVRLGIYADDGSNYPGALILDAGTVSAAAVAYVEATINQSVGPGRVWLVAVPQGCATTSPQVWATLGDLVGAHAAGATLAANNIGCVASSSTIPGALPTPFPAGGGGNATAPRIVALVS